MNLVGSEMLPLEIVSEKNIIKVKMSNFQFDYSKKKALTALL